MSKKKKINEAINILKAIGMPIEQQNERTAMCLLAVLNLDQNSDWFQAENQLIRIRGILDFIRKKLKIPYAENTRETIRDESIKPLVAAGILVRNPDKPDRATNSPSTVYQITPEALEVIRKFNTPDWEPALKGFLSDYETLKERYAKIRKTQNTEIKIDEKQRLVISSGEHSELIKKIIEDFVPRFARGADIIYLGDTGMKWGVFKEDIFVNLGISLSKHGQMPDLVLYNSRKRWIYLIESVTSNGPIDSRRYDELIQIFKTKNVGLVLITAFPNRSIMRKYLNILAWETEVWVADSPDHLIHFNGDKFIGPR